jgi:hypothetical protein
MGTRVVAFLSPIANYGGRAGLEACILGGVSLPFSFKSRIDVSDAEIISFAALSLIKIT